GQHPACAVSRRRRGATGGFMARTPFLVFVVAALTILSVFVAVAWSSSEGRDVDYAKATRSRWLFFLSLGVVLLIFFVLTIPQLPYPVEAYTPDRVVHAVGKQYAWSLTEGAGPTLASWDQDFSPSVSVPARTTVEFRVTTLDVNHGFSLYAP